MDYDDMIEAMYDNDYEYFETYYDSLTPAQQNIVDEIVARMELDEEEFNELIDYPQYYKEES